MGGRWRIQSAAQLRREKRVDEEERGGSGGVMEKDGRVAHAQIPTSFGHGLRACLRRPRFAFHLASCRFHRHVPAVHPRCSPSTLLPTGSIAVSRLSTQGGLVSCLSLFRSYVCVSRLGLHLGCLIGCWCLFSRASPIPSRPARRGSAIPVLLAGDRSADWVSALLGSSIAVVVLSDHCPFDQGSLKEKRSELGNITMDMVLGGMRRMIGMLRETSLLDPEEGIRFRGLSIPECQKVLPAAVKDGEASPKGLLWLLLTGKVPTKEQADDLSKELLRRSNVPGPYCPC